MKNFLNQFRKSLNPMGLVMFENFIFSRADTMVPSYGGGKWPSVKMGEAWGLSLPVTPDKAGRVTVNSPFGNSITTDPRTASAAFTFLVVSWYFESVYERLTPAGFAAFEAIKDGIRDAVYDKTAGYDTDAFWSLTD